MNRRNKSLVKMAHRILDKFDDLREDFPRNAFVVSITGNTALVFAPKMGLLDEGVWNNLETSCKPSVGFVIEQMSPTVYRLEYRWIDLGHDLFHFHFALFGGFNPLLDVEPVLLDGSEVVSYLENSYPALIEKVHALFFMRQFTRHCESSWDEEDGFLAMPEQHQISLPLVEHRASFDPAEVSSFIQTNRHLRTSLDEDIGMTMFFIHHGCGVVSSFAAHYETITFGNPSLVLETHLLHVEGTNVWKSRHPSASVFLSGGVFSFCEQAGKVGFLLSRPECPKFLPFDFAKSVVRDSRWFVEQKQSTKKKDLVYLFLGFGARREFVQTPMRASTLKKLLIEAP